jgi:hypothetical protein
MKFADKLWPLHNALAWVLTRDIAFTERARPNDFDPNPPGDNKGLDEVDVAWAALYRCLVDGAVAAFSAKPMTSAFRRIPPQTIENCNWKFDGQNAVLSDRSSGPNEYEAVIRPSDLLHKFSQRHEAFALNTTRIGQP